MNYRHAFHAGNFADVLKHAVLVRILTHLRGKDAAFRVIDTHAGAGRYDLASIPATRTGEWREGIGRLLDTPPDGEAGELLAPYLSLVRAENPGGEIKTYPGSPAIALSLTRPQDRLIFCELHPEECNALAHVVGRDRRAKAIEIDGWTALKAYVPPLERRGLVLIDPPFEEEDEFRRLEEGLAEAHRRWATGTYLVWYPIKDQHETDAFARRVARLAIPKILRVELAIRAPQAGETRLLACGLLVVNPPWMLERELSQLMPALARILGVPGAGRHRIDRIAA
ncbi:MAG: 23S rRNA (adenine(2030)-N(6))-methyltransferase RlmJ [Bradyrhizobiaceae bacterium]|nr:23S rRNA (adenine(2030)-N(6))-methyltransferase RlmJ [Bradyrhizobiaceae bacterium]